MIFVDRLLLDAEVPVAAYKAKPLTIAEIDAHPDGARIWATIGGLRDEVIRRLFAGSPPNGIFAALLDEAAGWQDEESISEEKIEEIRKESARDAGEPLVFALKASSDALYGLICESDRALEFLSAEPGEDGDPSLKAKMVRAINDAELALAVAKKEIKNWESL